MADTNNQDAGFLRRALGVFGYSRRALDLVWTTSRPLTIALGLLTLVGGILPAVIAYIGQLIVDGVVTGYGEALDGHGSKLLYFGEDDRLVVEVDRRSLKGP